MKRREAVEKMVWPKRRAKLALVPNDPGNSSMLACSSNTFSTRTLHGSSRFSHMTKFLLPMKERLGNEQNGCEKMKSQLIAGNGNWVLREEKDSRKSWENGNKYMNRFGEL